METQNLCIVCLVRTKDAFINENFSIFRILTVWMTKVQDKNMVFQPSKFITGRLIKMNCSSDLCSLGILTCYTRYFYLLLSHVIEVGIDFFSCHSILGEISRSKRWMDRPEFFIHDSLIRTERRRRKKVFCLFQQIALKMKERKKKGLLLAM